MLNFAIGNIIEPQNKSEVFGTVTERIINSDSTESFLPIQGAMVSAQISEQFSASIARSTLTDPNGEYSMFLSPDQSYNIVVYKCDESSDVFYWPVCKKADPTLDATVQKDFVLTEVPEGNFGTVTGNIHVSLNDGQVDEDDPPAVYVSFYTVLDCGYVEVTTLPASPDADGTITYTVELPFGAYDVVASAENFIPDTATVEVNDSVNLETLTDLNITERPGV